MRRSHAPRNPGAPRLAFVESNTSGTGRLFVRQAGRMGLRPVVLAEDPARWDSLAEAGAEVVGADTRDEAALLEACRRLAADGRLAGVTSSSEYFAAAAAAAARGLGLPAPEPGAIRACRDKEVQRTRLAAAGVGVPRFSPAASVEEALAAWGRMGSPVVVKPVEGSGSVGVRLCAGEREVAQHAAALLAVGRNERGIPVRRAVLVEKLLVGPEVSVEAFHGEVVGVTAKHVTPPPHFVETGHDYPARLPEEDDAAVRRTALGALRALGLCWGPVHLELRLTAAGPRIVEVNPRLAGGFIPELVRLASGVDLIAATLDAVAGRPPSLRETRSRSASIRFLLPPWAGTLLEVEGAERAGAEARVVEVKRYVELGAAVRRGGDFRDRIGHVLAVADHAADARAAAERAHAALRVRVRAEEPAAAGVA